MKAFIFYLFYSILPGQVFVLLQTIDNTPVYPNVSKLLFFRKKSKYEVSQMLISHEVINKKYKQLGTYIALEKMRSKAI